MSENQEAPTVEECIPVLRLALEIINVRVASTSTRSRAEGRCAELIADLLARVPPKLEPCAVCGVVHDPKEIPNRGFFIECRSSYPHLYVFHTTRDAAITYWNAAQRAMREVKGGDA